MKQKFVDHVTAEIKNIEVGDTFEADISNSSVEKYRMTLAYISKKQGKKFKTRVNFDGNLSVNRCL
jgi:hypothetical protein